MAWKKKTTTTLLGLAAAGLCLPALAATPARAAGTTVFPNHESGYCLDSNYHDPKALNQDQGAVYVDPCNAGNYQNWELKAVSGGINFIDAQTRKCLDSDGSGHAYTLTCNGDTNQKWHITPGPGTGTLRIQNAQTGLYLHQVGSGGSLPLPVATGRLSSIVPETYNWE